MGKWEGYKKTKIGWIPEDWNAVRFENAMVLQRGFDLPVNSRVSGAYPLIASNGVIDCHKDFKVEGPGVITGRSGTLGMVHYTEEDYWPLNTTLYSKEMYNNYPKFLYYLLTAFDIGKYGTGTSVPTLNRNYVHKVIIPLPTLPEQKKIASILTTVDDKISSIDQQIQQTEQLKKGLMEKLLTEGIGHTEFKETKIGRIPKGWGFYELNDISTVTRLAGYEYSSVWEEFDSGDILALKGYNIGKNKIIDKGFKYISNSLSLKLNRSRLYKGDIVFPCVGSIGNAVVINEDAKYHINQNIAKITPNSGIDSTFLVQFFLSHLCQKEVCRFNATTSQPNVLVGSLRKFRIGIPSSIEEQKQIATILSTVDDKIDILNQKKTQYQTLKKGLSQQLLTGQMRVKI